MPQDTVLCQQGRLFCFEQLKYWVL